MMDLKTAADNYEMIKNNIRRSANFMRDMRIGLVETFDCSILKRKMNNLKDSMCLPDNFAATFTQITILLLVLGPSLVCLGVCMCCQIRIADRDKNKMPAHMKKRQQVHIEINELML